MLINHITNFCNSAYKSEDTTMVCQNCGHPHKCSGGCKKCLEEVHYPRRYPNGKKDYDCKNLINFYVCDYSFKYASEMLYLIRKSEALRRINDYHILSIGCGGCPDLMAFESFLKENGERKRIQYFGLDKNPLWRPIHDEVKKYFSEDISRADFRYTDALDHIKLQKIRYANVVVIQYLISHLYNTNQIDAIHNFFDDLIKNVVMRRDPKKPFVILINDVNSNNRGRDYFYVLCNKLVAAGFHVTNQQFYFDYRIQNDYQRYGQRHQSINTLFDIPDGFEIYHPWTVCSSAQMLIELREEDVE